MKYELPWKLLYIKTAISQSCLLIRSRLNIVLLYILNRRIFMQCRKIHGNYFGQTQTVFWKLCQSPISLLCLLLCCRQFLHYYSHLYVDTCCMITAIDAWLYEKLWGKVNNFSLDKISSTPTIVQCIKPPK